MTDDETHAEPNRRGHWTGLIWLALGALLVKSLAFDAVAEDEAESTAP